MFCPVTELMSDSQDLHNIDLKILISHTMVGTKSESGFPLETRRLRKTPNGRSLSRNQAAPLGAGQTLALRLTRSTGPGLGRIVSICGS